MPTRKLKHVKRPGRQAVYVDSKGNTWDDIEFSEEEAQACSDSLHDCYQCSDCRDCRSCTQCIGCVDCSYCPQCSDCTNCHRCDCMTSCKNCHDSTRCVDCTDCAYCTRCSSCESCAWCTNSEMVRGAKSAESGRILHDLSRTSDITETPCMELKLGSVSVYGFPDGGMRASTSYMVDGTSKDNLVEALNSTLSSDEQMMLRLAAALLSAVNRNNNREKSNG